MLQRAAMHCNALQRAETLCRVYNIPDIISQKNQHVGSFLGYFITDKVLQRAQTRFFKLQHVFFVLQQARISMQYYV